MHSPVERPAPLVGAAGLPAGAMPLAPGYAGEDRNAAARTEALGYWSPERTAATITTAQASDAEAVEITEEPVTATATDGSEILQGDARARRVALIRQGLAALGLHETNADTRPHTAYRKYVDMYSR